MKNLVYLSFILIGAAVLCGCNGDDENGEAITLSIDSSSTQSIDADGGTTNFAVKSNSAWEITKTEEWVTINPVRGSGDAEITVTATENTSEGRRTAVITVRAGDKKDEITISQLKHGEKELIISATAPRINSHPSKAHHVAEPSSVTWKASDRIGVFYYTDNSQGAEGNNVMYSTKQEYDGNNVAVFSSSDPIVWDENSSKHTFYAIHPFNENFAGSLSALEITIPAVQDGMSGLEEKAQLISMVAGAEYEQVSAQAEMEFIPTTPLCNISFNFSGTVLNEEIIENISIRAKKAIAGTVIYDLLNDKGITEIKDGSNTIELTLKNNDVPQSDLNLWVQMNELPKGEEIEIVILTDNYSGRFTYSLQNDIDASYYSSIPINCAELLGNGNGWLSQTTSNCYMVVPGEIVAIPVSRAYSAWRDFLDTQLSGAISVELLWQEELGLIKSVSASDENMNENSFILVETETSKTGNATVVIKFDGVIKWTWHVWVTDYVPVWDDFNGNLFMTCNLGAASGNFIGKEVNEIVDTYGMYYQWGSLYPYPGPSEAEFGEMKPDLKPIYNAAGEELTYTISVNHELDYILEHPLHTPFSGGGNIFGGLTGDNSWNADGKKTIFDPCPSGWRVPGYKNGVSPWTGFGESDDFLIHVERIGTARNPDLVWYPFAGHLQMAGPASAARYHPSHGYLWTSSSYDDRESNILDFYAEYVGFPDVTEIVADPDGRIEKYRALPIRCVKE